jgi:CO/xanthine dehydrogenase Mo-binding subunit
VLVDNHEIQPRGCGEPPIAGMGGYTANAFFDAVGVRLNRLPLASKRIKEKLG